MGKKNTVEKNTQITKLKVLIRKKHILNALLSPLSHETHQFGDYKCTDIVKQEERLWVWALLSSRMQSFPMTTDAC